MADINSFREKLQTLITKFEIVGGEGRDRGNFQMKGKIKGGLYGY